MPDACAIVGLGAVGKALVEVLSTAYVVYVDDAMCPEHAPVQVKFLHIAFPWQAQFVEQVRRYRAKWAAEYVIVHSTVLPGTTRQLGPDAVHSPVRGQHDALADGIRRFTKYVGGVKPETVMEARAHLEAAEIKTVGAPSPEATELAKLLCSARYLNDLAFYTWGHKLCSQVGVPPEFALEEWTRTYNAGYAGTPFVRPDLTIPTGEPSGHCVVPNSRLLAARYPEFAEFITRILRIFSPS